MQIMQVKQIHLSFQTMRHGQTREYQRTGRGRTTKVAVRPKAGRMLQILYRCSLFDAALLTLPGCKAQLYENRLPARNSPQLSFGSD
jgi:hypothetical protein